MPHIEGVFISDENKPYFVPTVSSNKQKGKTEMVSTLQLGKSLRKGQQTYLVALVEIKSDQLVEVLDEVAQLLK